MYPLVIYPLAPSVFKWGLKARSVEQDREEDKTLDRVMEYTGAIGVEVADMLVLVNSKVKDLIPCVPAQHMFRGDSLHNFICNHQDHLENLKHQVKNLMTMTNKAVMRLQVREESNCQDLWRVEEVNAELLRWVVALEHSWGNPIEIPDSLEPLLV